MDECFTVEGVSARRTAPDDWNGRLAFILGHGAGQDMNSPFMSFFHSGIAGLGHLAVKFNFPYMESGRKAPDSPAVLRRTWLDMVDSVAQTFKPERIVVGGKSMGGRIASHIAGERDAIRGLVFLGYPLHPPGKTDRLRDEHLYAIAKPMLFLSGTKDPLARREVLERVVNRIGRLATLEWIEGGDHSFRVGKSDAATLPRALEVIRVWSNEMVI